jgi:hypothetical protein
VNSSEHQPDDAAWQSGGQCFTCHAEVSATGQLLSRDQQPAASEPHVYRILLVGGDLITVAGHKTRVLYIGQGGPGRVAGLWKGTHSACTRLARARWARREPFEVVVEVRQVNHPELAELSLLNAFVLRHGQLPVFNGRFEGWLPAGIMQAAIRQLADAQKFGPVFPDRPAVGPRSPGAQHGSTFTAIDLYGAAPPGKSWRWRGSLLWQWPDAWLEDADRELTAQARALGFKEGCFALVGVPDRDKPEALGWSVVPALFSGQAGWSGGAGARARVLNPGDPSLGGEYLASPGPSLSIDDLVGVGPVGPLAAELARWLPVEGTCG